MGNLAEGRKNHNRDRAGAANPGLVKHYSIFKELQALADKDKSSHEVDEIVSKMFRLHMAIALLKKQEMTGSKAA